MMWNYRYFEPRRDRARIRKYSRFDLWGMLHYSAYNVHMTLRRARRITKMMRKISDDL